MTAEFTTREREIAQFLVTGKTSKDIARQLGISHRTIEAHRARLMKKLNASTPGEMIARLAGGG
jgi:DNA-binding NarL/FixJ family response regulator